MTISRSTPDARQELLAAYQADEPTGKRPDRFVANSGRSFAWVIEDLILDALAFGDGPDDRARNAIESSRDWRDPPARRRSRFTAVGFARCSPSPSRRFS